MLLHGLTATRRYVVMGSRTLQRSGQRVLAYDARGHGASAPAADGDYGYPRLAADLGAALDAAGVERAVLGGRLDGRTHGRPLRARGARAAWPGSCWSRRLSTPPRPARPAELERWDALARGLREGGVEGFVAAYDLDGVRRADARDGRDGAAPAARRARSIPDAVADALEAVPRSAPFEDPRRAAAPRRACGRGRQP